MNDYNLFFMGWVFGMVTALCVVIYNHEPSNSIQSTKPITPEKRLTTDGKRIDTLYIYKIK